MAKKKQQPEENKDLLQLGQKSRSGRLLSEYIRAIGCECDQVIQPDTPKGCEPAMPRMVSKAEALARHIWSKALPHVDDEGNRHEPDLSYIRIVLERAEGKAGVVAEEKQDTGRETVPERVSRMNVERLNRMAHEAAGEPDA
jgi:hypothetical protein